VSPALRKALDPYIKLAPFVGIGLVVVAIVIAWVFYIQRGAHIGLSGSIQKTRTLALDTNSSAAIVDFRFQNPSDYQFLVRTVQVFVTLPDGRELEGQHISDVDVRRLFEYYPLQLGQKYNDSLVMRTKIGPRQAMDRMTSARFDVPEKQLQERKQLRVRIEEVDGAVSEILERHGS
jgi:hypothetical protein